MLRHFHNQEKIGQIVAHFKSVLMPRGRPPKGADYVPRKHANFRFPPELIQAIKVAAKRKKISQNAFVEAAIMAAIESIPNPTAQPKRGTL
jgi:predicted HicB family RNase H-like nuclease